MLLAAVPYPAFGVAALFGGVVDGFAWSASDLTKVWQDSGGSTPAAVNSPIGRIDDLSGKGRPALQATSGNRPTLKQATQNGIVVNHVELDGTDDFLGAAFVVTAYPVTMVLLGGFSGATSNGFFSLANSDSVYKMLQPNGSANARLTDRNELNLFTPVNAPMPIPSGFQIVIAEFEASSMTIQVNNNTPVTRANTNTFGTSISAFLGKTRPSGLFQAGRAAFAMQITRLLTSGEKGALKAMLAAQGGVVI